MRSRPHPRAALLAFAALLSCAACSLERHHRTLSFFFDGVPDPDAPAPEAPVAPVDALVPVVAAPAPEDRSSMHPPVRERLCHRCHQVPERAQGAGWQAGLPELVAPRAELCKRCHEPPAGPYVHGPAGAQRCDLCHEAHQSPFPHLLRQERQETLCTSCHEGELFLTRERHTDFGARDCSECHDPHASTLPALLRPGWEAGEAATEPSR